MGGSLTEQTLITFNIETAVSYLGMLFTNRHTHVYIYVQDSDFRCLALNIKISDQFAADPNNREAQWLAGLTQSVFAHWWPKTIYVKVFFSRNCIPLTVEE